jgi:hypothetical protein
MAALGIDSAASPFNMPSISLRLASPTLSHQQKAIERLTLGAFV